MRFASFITLVLRLETKRLYVSLFAQLRLEYRKVCKALLALSLAKLFGGDACWLA